MLSTPICPPGLLLLCGRERASASASSSPSVRAPVVCLCAGVWERWKDSVSLCRNRCMCWQRNVIYVRLCGSMCVFVCAPVHMQVSLHALFPRCLCSTHTAGSWLIDHATHSFLSTLSANHNTPPPDSLNYLFNHQYILHWKSGRHYRTVMLFRSILQTLKQTFKGRVNPHYNEQLSQETPSTKKVALKKSVERKVTISHKEMLLFSSLQYCGHRKPSLY